MALREGILKRPETAGHRLAAGLGMGVETFSSEMGKMLKERTKEKETEEKKRLKMMGDLEGKAKGYLKDFAPSYLGPEAAEDYEDLLSRAKGHLDTSDTWADALRKALKERETETGEFAEPEEKGMIARGKEAAEGYLGTKLEDVKSFINEGLKSGKLSAEELLRPSERHPKGWLASLASEEGRKKLVEDYEENVARPVRETLHNVVELGKKHPEQLVKEAPGAAASALESMVTLGGAIPISEENRLSTLLKSKLRQGLTPEEQKQAESASQLESLLAPFAFRMPAGRVSPLSEGLLPVKPAFKRIAKEIAAPEAAPASLAESLSKETAAPKTLAGRVSAEVPQAATQARVARAAPERRMFPKEQMQTIREEQLKNYPKYKAEIEADAAERAERLAKTPGPKALATRETKMKFYEGEMPKAQRMYQDAIARVRALENEVARIPAGQRAQAEALLNIAKQELNDSEYFLRQVINNAKTGEARVGLEEMRTSAQKKVLDLGDKIAAGEEVKLGKADYNPEFVKQAKAIEKKNKLPAVKHEDFYTQVHDEYANQYKARIAQIDEEIKPSHTGAQAMQNARLKAEKATLQKMVDSAEAENTIHRYKLALREMKQRQLAKERLGKLRPTEAEPKIKEAAHQRIAKIDEQLKSREGQSVLAEKAAQEAIQKNPSKLKEIAKEKESLKQAFEDLEKEKKQGALAKENIGKSKTEAEVIKKAKNYTIRMRRYVDRMLEKIPYIGQTDLGRDILKGALSGLVDSFIPGFKVLKGVQSGTISTFLFGRHGVGTIVSLVTRHAVKEGIDELRINNVVEAYQDKNRKRGSQKLAEYKKKYKPKIMTEAKNRIMGRE